MRSPYWQYCITVIPTCQQVFLCYSICDMRAIIIGGIVAIFIAGNHAQQAKPQPAPQQEARQQAIPKPVPALTQTAPAKQEDSCYQKAKKYLKKAFGPEYLAAWVLVIAAGIGIIYTVKTVRAIRKQTDALERQISIPNRAYFATGEPQMLTDGRIRIPIENYGRIAGRLTSVNIEIIVKRSDNGLLMYRHDVTKEADEIVIPGKNENCAIFVTFPGPALIQDMDVVIGGVLNYEVGFTDSRGVKITDIFHFCPVYSTGKQDWTKAWRGVDVDFSKEIPIISRQKD